MISPAQLKFLLGAPAGYVGMSLFLCQDVEQPWPVCFSLIFSFPISIEWVILYPSKLASCLSAMQIWPTPLWQQTHEMSFFLPNSGPKNLKTGRTGFRITQAGAWSKFSSSTSMCNIASMRCRLSPQLGYVIPEVPNSCWEAFHDVLEFSEPEASLLTISKPKKSQRLSWRGPTLGDPLFLMMKVERGTVHHHNCFTDSPQWWQKSYTLWSENCQ